MIHKPLQFYVDKIQKGEKFSLARFGDGELLCMWGRRGSNSNGCKYTPELRQSLLDSMNHKKDFIYGLQRVLPHDEVRMLGEYPNIEWYDSEIFSEAVAKGELYPLIEALRERPVTIIGNYSIREVTKDILPNRWFIEVPPSNSYDYKDKVINAIMWEERFAKEPRMYLFSCGMAANAIIGELHGKVNGWLLDLGHIWDPFTGSMSRCDLEGKTLEDINKNLHEKTE